MQELGLARQTICNCLSLFLRLQGSLMYFANLGRALDCLSAEVILNQVLSMLVLGYLVLRFF